MDSKTLCEKVADAAGMDPQEASDFLEAFANVLCDRASNLDSIAIPTFGNFVALKEPERIVLDPESGKRMLMPPVLKIEFVASGVLKKQVANQSENHEP